MKKTINGLVYDFVLNKGLPTAPHTFITGDQEAYNLLMASLEESLSIQKAPELPLHQKSNNKKRNGGYKGFSKVLAANGLVPADIKEAIEQHPYALAPFEKSIMSYIAGLGFPREHSYKETAEHFETLENHYTKNRVQSIFYDCLRKLLIARKPSIHGAALVKHLAAQAAIS